MYTATFQLYAGAATFPGWDNLTYIRDITLTVGESPYTKNEVVSAFGTNERLWDAGVLKPAVVEKLDTYIPNWRNVSMPAYKAPNFTGVSTLSPSNYAQEFNNLVDLTPNALFHVGETFYLRKLNNENYIYINTSSASQVLELSKVWSTYFNGYNQYGLSVYGSGCPAGDSWNGTSSGYKWLMSLGFPVHCTDGWMCLTGAVYSNNGTYRIFTSASGASQRWVEGIANFFEDIPESYTITYHLVHATGDSENPTSVPIEVAEGQDVFMRFYPTEGYDLKYGSVPIGTGYGPDDSVIYVWNAERGEMMIRGFTSDITVEVIGVAKPYPIDPSEPTDPGTIDPDSPNYDFSSTIIPVPSRPTWDYAQAGFCNVYLPTAQELNSLALYLWSGSFSADNFKKMFNNPMEAILGCHLVPLSLDDIDHDDGTLAYGNNDTGIEMKIALSNWISYDCGRVKLPVYYGAYLSYSPYTKIQIYLPFIGMHRLDADSIIGKYVHVVYRIDIVTGSCVALIAVGDDTENETVMYQFAGSCSTEIPVTQGDYKNALQILQGVVSSSVGMVSNVITSGLRGGYSGMAGAIGGMASGAVAGLGGAASALVDSVKPDISISGNLSSSTGYLGVRIPYLVISTPRVCLPDEQGRFMGLPIFATSRLQQLTGFTQVESIHLEGFYYTEDELTELEELLKSGVIL